MLDTAIVGAILGGFIILLAMDGKDDAMFMSHTG